MIFFLLYGCFPTICSCGKLYAHVILQFLQNCNYMDIQLLVAQYQLYLLIDIYLLESSVWNNMRNNVLFIPSNIQHQKDVIFTIKIKSCRSNGKDNGLDVQFLLQFMPYQYDNFYVHLFLITKNIIYSRDLCRYIDVLASYTQKHDIKSILDVSVFEISTYDWYLVQCYLALCVQA